MSESERAAFVEALDMLYGLGVVDAYADIHSDPDQDGNNGNNFNGPDTDSQIHRVLIFLPWHRQFTLEFERELQAINPKLSLPYWDWTGDLDPDGVNSRSAQSPLWSDEQVAALGWTASLIGSFNEAYDLERTLSGASLPTSAQKSNLLTSSAFDRFGNFRFELENNLHDPPHAWVGEVMRDMFISPRDPVFYIHHATVDYLWQLWTEAGHSYTFSQTDMPTFDGTVAGFPAVDPNDILNTVTQMGVFYAVPDQPGIRLHDYTVTNANRPTEHFTYPDSITVAASFQMPAGSSVEIHACEGVRLEAGVHIPAGAAVTIGTDAFCDPPAAAARIAGVDQAEARGQATVTAEAPTEGRRPVTESVSLKGFPNPFRESFTFQFNLPAEATVSLTLFDALGKVVASPMPQQGRSAGQHEILVDTRGLPNGIYSAVLLLHDRQERHVLRVVKSD